MGEANGSLPPLRLVRAGASAGAATVLGLAGHLAAGGAFSLVGTLLAFAAVLAPSWLLAGRERGWTAIAVVQVVAQQVIHPLLAGATSEPAALPHDVMFFLHVLGALAMAAWLRLGERRAWAAARRLAARILRWAVRFLAGAARPAGPAVRPHPADAVALPVAALLRHAVVRRGPPLPA
ncbi:MAG: hypothetical protein AB7J32_13680 [Pseudonocardia sp.]